MQTTIHAYEYDTSNPQQAEAYRALCEQLAARGLVLNPSLSLDYPKSREFRQMIRDLDGRPVEIETQFLFGDQWNTAPIPGISEKGLRVFNWHEDIWPNANIKTGYWVDVTDEMRAILRTTLKCGYCGKHYPEGTAPDDGLCNACLDIEYLTEEQLHLLVLKPAGESFGAKRALTEEQYAALLPRYRDAQIRGTTERGKARIAKQRAALLAKRDAAIENANREFDGMTWLMDRGLNTDNVIYYSHTGRFSYGWRNKVGPALVDDLREQLAGFPFHLDLETTGGRVALAKAPA